MSKQKKEDEKYIKIGYLFAFLTYLVVGIAGCFGFMGAKLNKLNNSSEGKTNPIASNFISMIDIFNIWAFAIQIIVFLLCTSSYPLLFNFLK